jgi:hypothetical protein
MKWVGKKEIEMIILFMLLAYDIASYPSSNIYQHQALIALCLPIEVCEIGFAYALCDFGIT